MEQSLYEKLGGSYVKVGDYLMPNLAIEETEQRHIGKYGRQRKRFLKDHRRVLYTNLLVSDKLDQHLAEIDHSCEEKLELLTRQMAQREGVTEALKAANQMEWVRRMNSISNRADEIVLHELVYC
ncbi:MAG: TnpV protein [Oscillospiraceae bacterium]|nr:TnpV protein [Oscillospiraceae bacterium]